MAPRAPGDSVRPRRSSGASVWPLNFTVRPQGLYELSAKMVVCSGPACCGGSGRRVPIWSGRAADLAHEASAPVSRVLGQTPHECGWVVRISEQNTDHAIYRRLLPTKTHTFVAVVSLVRLDQTLSVEQALAPQGIRNTDRTEVLENTHQPDTSRKTTCIRYSIHFKDKHAPNSPEATLDTTDRGFVCAHPTIPGTAVRASFSERGLENELDPSLWAELEDFLKDVQIESAPGVPAA